MTRLTDSGWHLGIQDWAAEHYGQTRQRVVRSAAFAPFEAHRPERFHQRPVVMLVLGEGSAVPVRAFADAVELIRISTSGFRVVLVADSCRIGTEIGPQWPIEQCLPEETWLAHRQSNWLAAAVDHLTWAKDFYGASYVLAPRNTGEGRETLSFLAWAYDAQQPVLSAALERFAQGEGEGGAGAAAGRAADSGAEFDGATGYRWGWDSLEPGRHERTFTSGEGARVDASIVVGASSGALVGGAGNLPPSLVEQAHRAGWSTAMLTPHDAGSASGRFLRGVFRACSDALRGEGLVITASAGEGWSSGVAENDGVLSQDETGGWTLQLDGVSCLRFDEQNARGVFAAVARICGARFR